jgi:hypothetical protein
MRIDTGAARVAPSPFLDEQTIRYLHVIGALDDDTATSWLLMLGQQERVRRVGSAAPSLVLAA